ncbi:MAG: HEPN domain-containing protein [Proteobacteria bacterium]|jgi:uncharacterized protein (UPF0332 family)|nr:HEPN domain-containing protein [Pseudomonadota bacterium]
MTPEQATLLRKAGDSLRAAKMLEADGLHDFAASRAYYTMFYIAQAFLLGDGLSFSSHSAVIAAFGRELAKTNRVPAEYHRYLIEGQDSRNVGDYDIGPGLSAAEAARQIERAEQFVALAERLLASPAPR